MNTETLSWSDVLGNESSAAEIYVLQYWGSEKPLAQWIEEQAAELWGVAEPCNWSALAEELRSDAAQQTVNSAYLDDTTWNGPVGAAQVLYSNDVYTVADNGEAEDYAKAANAASALAEEWKRAEPQP